MGKLVLSYIFLIMILIFLINSIFKLNDSQTIFLFLLNVIVIPVSIWINNEDISSDSYNNINMFLNHIYKETEIIYPPGYLIFIGNFFSTSLFNHVILFGIISATIINLYTFEIIKKYQNPQSAMLFICLLNSVFFRLFNEKFYTLSNSQLYFILTLMYLKLFIDYMNQDKSLNVNLIMCIFVSDLVFFHMRAPIIFCVLLISLIYYPKNKLKNLFLLILYEGISLLFTLLVIFRNYLNKNFFDVIEENYRYNTNSTRIVLRPNFTFLSGSEIVILLITLLIFVVTLYNFKQLNNSNLFENEKLWMLIICILFLFSIMNVGEIRMVSGRLDWILMYLFFYTIVQLAYKYNLISKKLLLVVIISNFGYNIFFPINLVV